MLGVKVIELGTSRENDEGKTGILVDDAGTLAAVIAIAVELLIQRSTELLAELSVGLPINAVSFRNL